jgi:hypothetical protein
MSSNYAKVNGLQRRQNIDEYILHQKKILPKKKKKKKKKEKKKFTSLICEGNNNLLKYLPAITEHTEKTTGFQHCCINNSA